MGNLGEALSGLIIISGAITIVFIISKYTYLIKKAMIEKGLASTHTNKVQYLEIGCVVVGLGLGLLISSVFTIADLSEDTLDLLIWGTILIFGGVGLTTAHFISKKLEK